jgi:hypothetical protein
MVGRLSVEGASMTMGRLSINAMTRDLSDGYKFNLSGSYLHVLALRISIVQPGFSGFLLSQALEIILLTRAPKDM